MISQPLSLPLPSSFITLVSGLLLSQSLVVWGQPAQTLFTTIEAADLGIPFDNFSPPLITELVVPYDNICFGNIIADVNVKLKIDHSAVGDLEISLAHNETSVVLYGDGNLNDIRFPCTIRDDIDAIIDDDGPVDLNDFRDGNRFDCPEPVGSTGAIKPHDFNEPADNQPLLSVFNGMVPDGAWILTIKDENNLDAGLLQDFGIIIECIDRNVCGPSIGLVSSCGETPLLCCDRTTGAVGPACCGSVPFDPNTTACCGDLNIVPGAGDACAPSTAPSPLPSTMPSATPSVSPSDAPSSTPSANPSTANCSDEENRCVETTKSGKVKSSKSGEPKFQVCLNSKSAKSQSTKCQTEAQIDALIEDDRLVSCGECSLLI